MKNIKNFYAINYFFIAVISMSFFSCDKDDDNNSNNTYVDNFNLSIGDSGPAGGYVFYVNPDANTDGWKYLEAAPADTEWNYVQWGDADVLVGGTKPGIGHGDANTEIIVEKLEDYNDGQYAAFLCDNLVVNNDDNVFDDWFLPSKDELNFIYTNLYDNEPSLGGFSEFNYYWSSTEYEYETSCAWGQVFYDGSDVDEYPYPPGYQSPSQKDSEEDVYSARAVRRF
ncbi:MAG: hypothetical protein ACOCWC_04260 [Bacteroidota bacterium]